MITKILKNKGYAIYVIPNEKDTALKGALLRTTKDFKLGRFKGKKSKYFLVELQLPEELDDDGDVIMGREERGRIVFSVSEFMDKALFNAIGMAIMKDDSFGEVAKEWKSESPLVRVKLKLQGAFYKVPAPHSKGDEKYSNVSFFVRESENNELLAIQTSFDYIKNSLEKEQGWTFDTVKPKQLPNVVEEVVEEVEEEEEAVFS